MTWINRTMAACVLALATFLGAQPAAAADYKTWVVEAGVASLASYEDTDDAGSWWRPGETAAEKRERMLTSVGLVEVDYRALDLDGDQEVLIAKSTEDRVLYVAFAGTSITEPLDIATDLSALPVPPAFVGPSGSALVHAGFKTRAKAFMNNTDLQDIIDDIDYAGYTLVFTGHSLGGAIAQLTAAYVADAIDTGSNKHRVDRMISFAAPMVGNAGFRDFYAGLSIPGERWVVDEDPVPPMPGDYGNTNYSIYKHAGSMNFVELVTSGFWFWTTTTWEVTLDQPGPIPTDDWDEAMHSLSGYIVKICEATDLDVPVLDELNP